MPLFSAPPACTYQSTGNAVTLMKLQYTKLNMDTFLNIEMVVGWAGEKERADNT
jgi:hypothetical protein